MADLTPEQLERLTYLLAVRDGLLVKLDEASGGDLDDDPSSTYHDMLRSVSLEFMDSATALVQAARRLERITSSMEEMAVDFDRLGLIGGDLTATEIRRRMKEVLDGGT